MNFTQEFVLQLLLALGSGFGAYAAIRADLARLHERADRAIEKAVEALEASTRAHKRIDHQLERRSN